MKGCNPTTCTLDKGPELSLKPAGRKMLNEEAKKRYKPIMDVVMYLGQVSRYDTILAVN